MSPRNQTVSS